MDRQVLREKIIDVIQDALSIKFREGIDFSHSFLDPRIGLYPRDLIIIFFEIQKAFHINFEDSDILDRRFDFLDNIVTTVSEKVGG